MAGRSRASELRAQARTRRRRTADGRDGGDPTSGESGGFDLGSAAREAASAAAYGATVGAGESVSKRRTSERRDSGSSSDRDEANARGAKPEDVTAAVERARGQLEAVQGRPVESVSGIERLRDGWKVDLEVVELSRIPDTTDVLATYEVVLDDRGNLKRYSRRRRYHRADADGETA